MPAPEFPKRTAISLVIAATAIAALTTLPIFEHWLQTSFFPQFGWSFESGWLLTQESSRGSMMASTYAGLIEHFFRLLKVFLAMALVITVIRFLADLIFVGRTVGQREISSLLRTVLSVTIYVIAFAIIFQTQYPSVNLGSIFAGSAIFGIVVGLALQDTLGNLFAGIALQADQPFQVGDVVNIPNRGAGVVETVSWRGVKIRTFQNKLLIISNSVLGKESIEVGPKGNLNARIVNFSTLYSSSPAQTAQVVRDAVRIAENVSQKIRPVVRIRNLGDNGIDWDIKYWLEDYAKYNDTDALVRQRIWYALQREKIEFCYPTRTIHVETKPQEKAFDEHINTVTEMLNRVELFAPLSDEETNRVAETSRVSVYAPGEAIVRKGREGKSMFVILRGSVDVQIPAEGGPRVLGTLSENEYFGEMSLLTGEPRTATVVAAEETEVLIITKESLRPIFHDNPDLVKAIGDKIGERQELLRSIAEEESESQDLEKKGLLISIKRFFGLR